MALIPNFSGPVLNMSCPNLNGACADVKSKHDCNNNINLADVALTLIRGIFGFLINYFGVLFLAVIVVFIFYVLYKSYWSPVVYVKELTEVGFEHIPKGPDRDRKIARAQAARRLGSKIPPPYPNGWFAVAESRDLKIGDVQAVDALGQNLCVYRGADGAARCVDAYCPHLGASLAAGGGVRGACIQCPFHMWRFDGQGACVGVPGDNAPKGVSIRTWQTAELDGAVWIWHDAAQRAPLWRVAGEALSSKWGYRGRNEFYVSAHIQEIPENGADVAHLNAVHSPSLLTGLGETYPLLHDIIGRHVWNATWSNNGDHTARMTLSHDYKILKYNFIHADLNITQLGPGHVRLYMQTSVGPFLLSQSVTPLSPLLQKVVHRLYSPTYNAPIAGMLIYSESKMIERDIKIWNNKRFVSAPAYVKTDKTIRAFRNWYSQFYSEESRSFRECVQNNLDW